MKTKLPFLVLAVGLVAGILFFFLPQRPEPPAPAPVDQEEDGFLNSLIEKEGVYRLEIKGHSPYSSEGHSVVDSVSILPLRANQPSSLGLQGGIRKVVVTGNYVLALTAQFELAAFSTDGNFIRMATAKGERPGETLQISDFVVLGNKIYTLEASKSYVQAFDLKTFSYLKSYPLHPDFTYTHFEHFQDQWFLYCVTSLGGSRTIHRYNSDFSALQDSLLPNQISPQSVIMTPAHPFTKGKDFLRITATLNDTVFQYAKNKGAAPYLILDFGDTRIGETEKRTLQEGTLEEVTRLFTANSYSRVLDYAENDRFIWMALELAGQPNANDIYVNKEGKTWFQLADITLPKLGLPINGSFAGMHGDFFVFAYTNLGAVRQIETKLQASGDLAPGSGVGGFLAFVRFR